MRPLRVGDQAPDFSLPSVQKKNIRLSEILGHKIVVLYFYPGDFTSGCTVESCAFRDHYAGFKDLGAEVYGISRDDLATHRAFTDAFSLPFDLLSDPDGKVHKLYGIGKRYAFFKNRVTFVIGSDGVILSVFDSLIRFSDHAKVILKKLRPRKSR